MQIRFVSTLTADDEDRLAETLVETVKSLLSALPIGYLIRVETNRMRVFEHNRVFESTEASALQTGGLQPAVASGADDDRRTSDL